MQKKPFLFFAAALILLATVLGIRHQEANREWKRIQKSSHHDLKVKEVFLAQWNIRERCLTCHFGLEEISGSHPVQSFGCTICHGGNGLALDKDLAHQGLWGGRNPSDFRVIYKTCGRRAPDGTLCHAGHSQVEKNPAQTSPRSLMATMAGVIAGLRYTWGAQLTPEALYGSVGLQGPDKDLKTIPFYNHLSLPKDRSGAAISRDERGNTLTVSGQYADDQWRKFCSRCHLNNERPSGPSAHGGGCSSCHVARNETGTYEGRDRSLSRTREGYGKRHHLTAAIATAQCLRCHNRSGRIGLTFSGLMESDQYGTPYQQGRMNPNRLSGGRFVQHLTPDIHFEKGMHCIDCHTAGEIMGDGRITSRMFQQVKIRCRDCHGTEKEAPKTYRVQSEEDPALWASAFGKTPPLKVGDELLRSSGGHTLVNIRKESAGWVLYSKVDGRRHPLKIITRQPGAHRFPGHGSDRMECFSCHSRWAPQCYGCHDYRKNGENQLDAQARVQSPGRWQETRDYYRFEDPPLGINQRGRVSPFMPGCQVLVTLLDARNQPLPGWDRAVHQRTGFTGIVAGPINPHSTRKEVRPCQDCHGNPKLLGLGSGLLISGKGRFADKHLSPHKGEQVFPYSWESLSTPEGRPLQSVSRPEARPFNQAELNRILRVTPCLPCHDSYQDPIYRNFEKSLILDRSPKHLQIVNRFLKGLPR